MLKLAVVLSFLVAAALADVKCPSQGLFKTKSPSGCRQYIQCKDGKMTVQSCSTFLKAFDPVKLECDYCWKVNCSAPASPWPAPTTVRPTEPPTTPAPVTKDHSVPTKPVPVTKDHSTSTKPSAPVTKDHSVPTKPAVPVTKDHSTPTKPSVPVTKDHNTPTKPSVPVTKETVSSTKASVSTSKNPEIHVPETKAPASNNENAKVSPHPTTIGTTEKPGFWGKVKHFFGI